MIVLFLENLVFDIYVWVLCYLFVKRFEILYIFDNALLKIHIIYNIDLCYINF